jgi:hypothetical protein
MFRRQRRSTMMAEVVAVVVGDGLMEVVDGEAVVAVVNLRQSDLMRFHAVPACKAVEWDIWGSLYAMTIWSRVTLFW